jgi:DNA polymerase-3 subunit epsilon
VRIEDGREVARWSSLVNPGTPISSFIQRLTGISNPMVRDAPAFAEVAPRLQELLDDAVLVAHNARFDHGFLQNEFARLPQNLLVQTLCTVRLSRLLYPQQRSHGLDAIMQRHGLRSISRHRAMGDVEMVLAWLAIAQQEHGLELVRRHAATLIQGAAVLPAQLETPLTEVPESVGVYLFYGHNPRPLYVGKSLNMRQRVLLHFQASERHSRQMHIAQEVRRIEWIETAGEIGAMLLAARLIKERQPLHNRRRNRPGMPSALAEQGLQAWPYPGRIGLREHNHQSGKTAIHVFDQWCHLATAQDDAELAEALVGVHRDIHVDLDTYRLLIKQLAATRRSGVELLRFDAWTD